MARDCCVEKAGAQLCEAATDPAASRRRRKRAAKKYRPERIRLLIVAEAPPNCLQRYFYFEDVTTDDWLFRAVVKTVLKDTPARAGKRAQLERLRDEGVWLTDLKADPKASENEDLSSYVDDLVKRVRKRAPEHVVLVKVNVFDTVYGALHEAGLPVLDVRMPFPSSGRQTEFKHGMQAALEAIGWERVRREA